MTFKTLTLENFGLYGGCQTLELTPAEGRPVVLVGGTNGAGKTTILEAIMLCLHGRRAIGSRVSKHDYDSHLRSRLHVASGGDVAEQASVTLAFSYAQSGRVSDYSVSRSWARSGSGAVKETVAISRDGSLVEDLPAAARQDFLDGLLPPGIAGLFLFDGEKIQALAEDETGEQLADAVHRLLGLDLVDQLRRDLRRFATVSAAGDESPLVERLAQLEVELVDIDSRLIATRDREATLRSQRDLVAGRAERQYQRFAQEGGALAKEREGIAKEAARAAADVSVIEEELRLLVAGLLPFALAPELARSLAARLEREQVAEEDEIVLRRLNAAAAAIKTELQTKSNGQPLPVLRRLLSVNARRRTRVHELSPAQRAVLLDRLAGVAELPQVMAKLRRRLAKELERHERAQALLAQVPEDRAVADLLAELAELEREVGALDGDLAHAADELRQLEYERAVVARERRAVDDKLKTSSEATKATVLAVKTENLLEEFAAEAEGRRLKQIETETAWYFNRLSRKGEMLSAVAIDPVSFRVNVSRWDGSELPKERLSAGERQLFAIAVLWALAKVSRRQLPVVIDTPLARLDREHRRRLLEQYFPEVSHQVVVLSTDTEVDAAAAAELDAVIARKFWLNHDIASGVTTIEDGYFRGLGEAHAR